MDLRTGMNLGADDYMTKPFEGLDLLKVVEIRIKKSQQMKANNKKRSLRRKYVF
jgi:DNA-binding response OmpR family regulator